MDHAAEAVGTAPPRSTWWRRPAVRTAGVIAAAVVLSVPTTAWAVTSFSDVGEDHPFVDDITAIADAGITTGYGDGTYRPGDTVTRGAMAAFMHRGYGRIASATTPETGMPSNVLQANGGTGRHSVLSVDVVAGAEGGGGGWVVVTGALSAYTANGVNCGCKVSAAILGPGETSSPSMYETLGPDLQQNGWVTVSMAPTMVFPIQAGETGTYTLELFVDDANLTSLNYEASLNAQYVPFDGQGNGLGTPAP